jgi:hypothetical protein
MDKGAQKMKSPDKDEDRKITVTIFADATYDGTAKITSYEPMLPYLNGNLIKILYGKLPKTSSAKDYCDSGRYYDAIGKFNVVSMYGVSDAKLYLEWLISVVRGSEKVSEDLKNEAYDQLDKLILALRDVTKYDKQVVLMKPYDWIVRLEKFENQISEDLLEQMKDIHDTMEFWETNVQGYNDKLDDICDKLDERAKALVTPLEEILAWMRKYSPTLDKVEKEYASIFGKKRKATKNV